MIAIVNINKIEPSGSYVKGALLNLKGIDSKGNIIKFTEGAVEVDDDADLINGVGESIVWISGSSTAKVKLTDGTYILQEQIAPDGYKLSEDIVFIIYNGQIMLNGSNVDSINMIDKPVPVITITTTTVSTAPSTTTSTTPPAIEHPVIRGDVNEDGIVDASDASCVLAAYAKIQTGGESTLTDTQTKAADVNNDRVVDASDASKILAYYAAISTGQKPTW